MDPYNLAEQERKALENFKEKKKSPLISKQKEYFDSAKHEIENYNAKKDKVKETENEQKKDE